MRPHIRKSCLITALLLFLAGGAAGEDKPASTRLISLPEVLRLALRNNFDIRLARTDQEINSYFLEKARAAYDTLLTGGFDYTHDNFRQSSDYLGSQNKTADYGVKLTKTIPWGTELSLEFANRYQSTDSTFATLNPSTDSSLKVALRQPLLKNFGGKLTRGKIDLTRINVDNLNLAAWQRMELSLAEAARTYWDLVEIQAEVLLEEKMEERARYLFELSQRQLKMGMLEKVDLVAAEANLKIRESELIFDREELITISRRLKYLIDDRSPELILPADILALPSNPVFAQFPESMTLALQNRWDYLRALQELQADDINLNLKENSRWPEVDLIASFARNGLSDKWSAAARDIFEEDNPQYYAGIQFSYSLEDRLAGSEFRQAELEKARSIIVIKQIEREIYTRVDEQLRGARVSLELARRENYIQSLQQKKLTEEEKRFKYGRSNSKTVIDYQNDLLLSQLQANKALTVYHKSLIDLQVAEGVFLRRQLGAE